MKFQHWRNIMSAPHWMCQKWTDLTMISTASVVPFSKMVTISDSSACVGPLPLPRAYSLFLQKHVPLGKRQPLVGLALLLNAERWWWRFSSEISWNKEVSASIKEPPQRLKRTGQTSSGPANYPRFNSRMLDSTFSSIAESSGASQLFTVIELRVI